ncbi:hypothetical protein [Kineococcus sp. G2]|uniref:hypothetical protein n=1 Tax=Kineococcus sp. G2 TaxID=3127484 RepID=UPI00301DA249
MTPTPSATAAPVRPAPSLATAVAAPAAPRRPVRSALEHALEHALDADHRLGTVTALLLVEVADPGTWCPAAAERRMRTALRAADRWLPLDPGVHAVLLTGLRPAGAEGTVERAVDAVLHALEMWEPAGEGSRVSVSVGASLAPTRAATAAEAVRQAAAALELARSAGGDCARISAA